MRGISGEVSPLNHEVRSSTPISKIGASLIVTVSTPANFSWMGRNCTFLILTLNLNILGVLINTRNYSKRITCWYPV